MHNIVLWTYIVTKYTDPKNFNLSVSHENFQPIYWKLHPDVPRHHSCNLCPPLKDRSQRYTAFSHDHTELIFVPETVIYETLQRKKGNASSKHSSQLYIQSTRRLYKHPNQCAVGLIYFAICSEQRLSNSVSPLWKYLKLNMCSQRNVTIQNTAPLFLSRGVSEVSQ